MTKKLFLLILFIFINSETFAQEKPSIISKLEIGSNETYWAGPSNLLLVDTLILHNRSTIQFLSGNFTGGLEAKVAFVGENVVISTKANDNYAGVKGGNIYLQINFASLGSLKIDTRGTHGKPATRRTEGTKDTPPTIEQKVIYDSKGYASTINITVPGYPGDLPKPGRSGIAGGSGGDIVIFYSTSGFDLNFNNEKSPHSVHLLFEPGRFIKGVNRRRKEPEAAPANSSYGTVKITKIID